MSSVWGRILRSPDLRILAIMAAGVGVFGMVDGSLWRTLLSPTIAYRQAILFTLEAWDVNCSQHIPLKFDAEDVAAVLSKLKARVDELTAENDRLRAVAASAGIAG